MGFTKEQITKQISDSGLVPLFTHEDAGIAEEVLTASYQAGIRAFEFTNRRANSFETFKSLSNKRKNYPDLMLGIGTVMDAATTEKFIDAGADFIISPILKTEMASVCHRHNIHWIPGSATLTEIVTAKEYGADLIKVFPGSVLGPQFISAIMPVVPGLKLMITGGVEPTEQNLRAWFKAGATAVGMGSQLFTKEILEKRDWAALRQTLENCQKIVKQIKG
jgi:2-dehydro-3-deoxyphosphogluconate aldolase / (4S)-4-hydroxy-2-oxoglutarate aldolase